MRKVISDTLSLTYFWIFGKSFAPSWTFRVDYNSDRVYAVGMTRDQADNLPEFSEDLALDYDYEESVRVYHSGYWCFGWFYNWLCGTSGYISTLDASAPGCSLFGFYDRRYGKSATSTSGTSRSADYLQPTPTPKQEPSLYDVNEQDQTLRLYQERLVANKQRVKTGSSGWQACWNRNDSGFSPDWKERVVIERVTPTDAGRAVAPGCLPGREVAHVEIYEGWHSQEAFVREEVKVTKVVEQETVEAQETLRREELDVDSGSTNCGYLWAVT